MNKGRFDEPLSRRVDRAAARVHPPGLRNASAFLPREDALPSGGLPFRLRRLLQKAAAVQLRRVDTDLRMLLPKAAPLQLPALAVYLRRLLPQTASLLPRTLSRAAVLLQELSLLLLALRDGWAGL
jgi:hypothetical protein